MEAVWAPERGLDLQIADRDRAQRLDLVIVIVIVPEVARVILVVGTVRVVVIVVMVVIAVRMILAVVTVRISAGRRAGTSSASDREYERNRHPKREKTLHRIFLPSRGSSGTLRPGTGPETRRETGLEATPTRSRQRETERGWSLAKEERPRTSGPIRSRRIEMRSVSAKGREVTVPVTATGPTGPGPREGSAHEGRTALAVGAEERGGLGFPRILRQNSTGLGRRGNRRGRRREHGRRRGEPSLDRT